MRVLAPVFANVVLLLAVLGFGSLVRAIYPRKYSRVDAAALTLLGGIGVVGLVLFCVGQIWFTRTSILLVLGVGILLSVRPAVRLDGGVDEEPFDNRSSEMPGDRRAHRGGDRIVFLFAQLDLVRLSNLSAPAGFAAFFHLEECCRE